jgi:hypothetical protein
VEIQDNFEGEQVSKLFASRRWLVIIGISAILVLASGGAAYAYFTSNGSGTGSATVGSAGSWTVTEGSSNGTMSPGSGNSVIVFEVQNTGSGDEQFSNAIASIASVEGDITQGGVEVDECQSDWFSATVTNDPHLDEDVGPGNTVQVTVKVTMPSDPSDNQDECQGQDPDVNLSIS